MDTVVISSDEEEPESKPVVATRKRPVAACEPENEKEVTIRKRSTFLTKDDRLHAEYLLDGCPDDVMCTKFNLTIFRQDLHSLAPGKWLNDNVINFYLAMIADRSQEMGFPSVYAMSTFFSSKLLNGGGYNAVRRWTHGMDIFAYELILIPVHLRVHWTLAVIDIPGQSIQYYDSLGGTHDQLLKALEVYLAKESRDKRKKKLDTTKWSKEHVAAMPRQTNFNDCGVYVCFIAEHLTRQRRLRFRKKNVPDYRTQMLLEIYEECLRL
ncbi:sentrin-specific protease 1-like [Drosophila obscura]|uniref:sentrin-specific protease 1-like n=1 Tax=Drosophila obscura TaxID=7282 RepID=UPI000BA0C4D3|nr:sentrin-specific protease 1-like [Drosophila obscura]XP_022227449.1 sentrin-specific protease 1-like [Drosophila obscura]